MTQDVYSKTGKGQHAPTDDSVLERRHLISLRLVDKNNLVYSFRKHLIYFDIDPSFSQSLFNRFMVQNKTENQLKHVDILKLSGFNAKHSKQPLPISAQKTLDDSDTQCNLSVANQHHFAQQKFEVDDVTASFMKRYLKNVSDNDPDIQDFIAEIRINSAATLGVSENILLRLKCETRPYHDAIERVPLMASLFSPNFDLDAYGRLLSAQLHFYRPYEAMLKKYPHVVEQNLWRSKAPLLEADLMALQMTGFNHQPDAQVEPRLDHPVRMLGVLYVFEGATLGGAVIRKHLLRTLGDQLDQATNFYHCYGDHNGLHWKRFQNLLLDTVAEHPEWADDIVSGACMTFASMTKWLTQFTHSQ